MTTYQPDKYSYSVDIPLSEDLGCDKLTINANKDTRDSEKLA